MVNFKIIPELVSWGTGHLAFPEERTPFQIRFLVNMLKLELLIEPKVVGTSSNGMTQNETLQRIASVSFSFDHLYDLVLQFLSLPVATCPIISCSSSVGCYKKILRVVEITVW